MLRKYLYLLALVQAPFMLAQSSSEFAAVALSATVQKAVPSITLSWTSLPNTSSVTIYRKLRTASSWGAPIASPGAATNTYVDGAVTIGTAYEYKVVRVAAGNSGAGYLCSGIEVPATDQRGKIILLVDNTFTNSLAPELAQLQADMVADGWTVLRSDISRSASVNSVRNTVVAHYNADPTNVKALFIVGHVPVPYSGNQNPDGHSEHRGAWPCDGYYADVNGNWSDNIVNVTTAARTANNNIPGDGKFDQSDYPSALELQVGRVDMFDMPAFAQSETQLLRTYLNKLHAYKVKAFTPQERAILFDNLQWSGSPMAASGWRNFAAMVGSGNVTAPYGSGFPFTYHVNGQSYLWSYASGGGMQATVGGVLTYNGANNVAITEDLAGGVALGSVFNMSFGSYFGDWDNKNNFLRAWLASGDALVNCYSAIPAWYVQHMAMGETIGTSTLATMNNTSLYTPLMDGWQGSIGRVHLGLMGDPTLRLRMIAPPSNLAVTNASGLAAFTWTASNEPVMGYHIDRINANGSLTRLNTNPISGTFYQSSAAFVAGAQYMVRAAKVQTTASGTFINLSLGSLATAAGNAVGDCMGVVGGTALPGSPCNDNNPCTSNDTWNNNCQCVGTWSGPTSLIAAASSTAFCTGGSVVLHATAGAGNTYSWKRDGNTIAGANASSYTATLSGSHTVTVSNNGCAVVSPAVTITAHALPTVVTSANIPASTVTATVSGTPGPYVYAWTTNPVQTTPTATVTSSGSYTVGVTDANGCARIASVSINLGAGGALPDCNGVPGGPATPGSSCNDNDPCTTNDVWSVACQCAGTPVSVTATITPTGPTTFCSGGSVALSATTGAGYTYAWKRNGNTIAGAAASSFIATEGGNHTVTISKGGCTRTSSPTSITVKAKPVIVCTADALASTVTASATGAPSPYVYAWTTNPVQTTATANVSAAGTYTVGVTAANGCGDIASVDFTPAPTTTLCDGLRTESQTTWGQAPAGTNSPSDYMATYFSWVFPAPSYLTIGCGTKLLRLTNAYAVTSFLPATATATMLPSGTLIDPGNSYDNGLAGELIALKLSMKFDQFNPAFSSSQVMLKDMLIGSPPFQGWTVAALADEADRKLGSCGSTYTFAQLRTAIRTINNGYEGGTEAAGVLLCNGAPKSADVEVPDVETTLEVVAFPNPFNGTTTLVLPATDEPLPATVQVFNSTGALVADLFNGEQAAGGDLLLPWNATDQPMGVYFFRVSRGGAIVTGKLLVQ